ncbi:MAG: lipid-binding SYLF domain-containing protein [Verrucomicrobia bacterium]|nr:lipid-binding SYLF domain-containing protein [Verrucomicrobiota bacterium]
MKTTLIGLILMGFVASTLAVEKAELDIRIRSLTAQFDQMQRKPDKCIPAEYLRKAQGIVLLERGKGGLVLGYQGGGGVALVRDGEGAKWGPAAFVRTSEGSFGAQIGGEHSFVVVLLMNKEVNAQLTQPKFEFAGQAQGTAGNASGNAEGKVSNRSGPVLVYIDRKGLYGGAVVKCNELSPNDEANRIYYGEFLTMKDILFDKKVKPTEATVELGDKLAEYSTQVSKK